MHPLRAGSTTATPCCMACQATCCKRYNLYRPPPHVWLLGTHHSSPAEVAVAAGSSKSRNIQAVICLVHQSLAGQTPAYLAHDIQLIADTGRPQLRSASERICVIPHTHTTTSATEVSLLPVLVCERLAATPPTR